MGHSFTQRTPLESWNKRLKEIYDHQDRMENNPNRAYAGASEEDCCKCWIFFEFIANKILCCIHLLIVLCGLGYMIWNSIRMGSFVVLGYVLAAFGGFGILGCCWWYILQNFC